MKSRLLEELKIGAMTVKNAVFMAPMSLGYESPDGTVNETMQEYWLARARGGVGCIITDALSVDQDVPYLGNTLCFRNEESIASYRRFTDRIHEYGTKIIPQITHPGPESVSAFRGIPPVASSVYLNSMAQRIRAVTLEEIPGIIQKYAKGAYDARRAGFDGIELHCAHAYMLLGSFLSPMRNKRTDRYGGSLDNRARLLCEVLDAIREACGPDFPVILRMSGSERDEQGNTLEDMKYLVPVLERHGVAAFEISGGTQYERCNKIIPCHGEVQGVNVPEAEALHEAASVPVIVVGKINEPRFAGYLVDSGKVDGVVLGRALIADPDFVNKMEAGDYEGIAPCAACAIGCVGEQTKRHPASCVINPAAGREKELELTAAEQPKRVVIVGGGIGGMACARAFAVRGHEVVLLEREMELGGQMRLACIPPHKQELSKWIVYLEHELERLSVDVRLNTAADRAVIDGLAPEVLILATGAKEMLPPVPGIDPEQAVTAWQVLSGETVIPGGNVLVVGGGMVGCEICEYLMHQKRGSLHITMIEMADEIGAGMVVNNRVPTMIRLNRPEITMMTGTKLMSVNGSDVTVERHGVQETFGGFTHVIYACGARPARALYDELKEAYPEAVLIGDASQPAQALEAVRQAVETAVRLG
ncbi:MAG: FAD-dependent oxidoreductase [Hungatella hathewayi]|uniref:oxidoreductase n=1 Tax=Hungatella TaxID=1649459 RepID=UPI00258F9B8E|nr:MULTISPECIES: FAD-dependent oxidoreductase [Hungatella]MCI7381929.1 FAD-dependent oxidoreductase [Hungatella sp.]MDY6238692.1 FAD-dependent oxidoreductase [Hungatella hathewayi]